MSELTHILTMSNEVNLPLLKFLRERCAGDTFSDICLELKPSERKISIRNNIQSNHGIIIDYDWNIDDISSTNNVDSLSLTIPCSNFVNIVEKLKKKQKEEQGLIKIEWNEGKKTLKLKCFPIGSDSQRELFNFENKSNSKKVKPLLKYNVEAYSDSKVEEYTRSSERVVTSISISPSSLNRPLKLFRSLSSVHGESNFQMHIEPLGSKIEKQAKLYVFASKDVGWAGGQFMIVDVLGDLECNKSIEMSESQWKAVCGLSHVVHSKAVLEFTDNHCILRGSGWRFTFPIRDGLSRNTSHYLKYFTALKKAPETQLDSLTPEFLSYLDISDNDKKLNLRISQLVATDAKGEDGSCPIEFWVKHTNSRAKETLEYNPAFFRGVISSLDSSGNKVQKIEASNVDLSVNFYVFEKGISYLDGTAKVDCLDEDHMLIGSPQEDFFLICVGRRDK